jgi:hypothetical protein
MIRVRSPDHLSQGGQDESTVQTTSPRIFTASEPGGRHPSGPSTSTQEGALLDPIDPCQSKHHNLFRTV